MLSTWYCIRCFLRFFLGKKLSRIHCNFGLFLIVYDILWSSKMFYRFFKHSSRVIAQDVSSVSFSSLHVSRIHCNFGLISMVYACYSTRWLLNLLKNKRFLHSMHVIAQDVCWISFSEKTFFSHTLQLRVHHFSPLFFTLQLHLLYVSSLFFSTTSSSWCFFFSHVHHFCTNYFLTRIVVSYHLKI